MGLGQGCLSLCGMTPSRPSIHVGLFDGIGHMGLGQALSILMRNDTFPSFYSCGVV